MLLSFVLFFLVPVCRVANGKDLDCSSSNNEQALDKIWTWWQGMSPFKPLSHCKDPYANVPIHDEDLNIRAVEFKLKTCTQNDVQFVFASRGFKIGGGGGEDGETKTTTTTTTEILSGSGKMFYKPL